MENISIQTTQNVDISHNLAGVGNRILASILDRIFMGLYLIVFILLFGISKLSSPAIIIISVVIPILIYHLVCEVAFHGQSFGKKIMKIKVVMLDGSQPNFTAYFIRWIFRLIDILITGGVLAIIIIIFSKNGQRLGDYAAGTTVIKLAPVITLDHLVASVNNEYITRYPQVINLNESDIHTLNEVVEFCKSSYFSVEAKQLLYKARLKSEKKMGITSEMNDYDFIETVIKDYGSLNR